MKLVTTLLVLSVILSGCFLTQQPAENQQNVNANTSNTNGSSSDNTMMDDGDEMMEEGDSMMEDDSTSVSFSGTVLGGSTSPVIDFNKADFDAAIAANKNIVLYFYASWCPVCRAEVPRMYSAFDKLNDPNVVAFRVNYNDSDTDDNERALAREHGVAYQHTKVFLENGQRVLKSPESWNEDRYLSEINSVFSN